MNRTPLLFNSDSHFPKNQNSQIHQTSKTWKMMMMMINFMLAMRNLFMWIQDSKCLKVIWTVSLRFSLSCCFPFHSTWNRHSCRQRLWSTKIGQRETCLQPPNISGGCQASAISWQDEIWCQDQRSKGCGPSESCGISQWFRCESLHCLCLSTSGSSIEVHLWIS